MKKKNGKRFEETVTNAIRLAESTEEAKPDGPWRIEAVGITADAINGNGRRYPADVLERAVNELKDHLHESNGQGRMLSLTGEADHPADKGNRRPLLSETVFNWDRVDFDGGKVLLEGYLLGTSAGKDIHAQMLGGVIPGISQRGYGESKKVKVNDAEIEEVTQLIITGYDATAPHEQSDPNGRIHYFESNQGEIEMDAKELLETLKQLLEEKPELFGKKFSEADLEKMGEAQLKKVEESIREKLNIGAEADLGKAITDLLEKARKYEESLKQAEVTAAITEAVKDLPFGKQLNEQFEEALKEAEFASAEQVKKFAESKRAEYGKIAASLKLETMGFKKGTGTQVTGSVFESETGQPEYARAAHELAESVRRVEMKGPRDWNKPVSLNEMFTKRLLERFDALHQSRLLAESKALEEASVTTDLNLPYSVSRALIEEAFPNLVAAGIFDVGIMNNSPERLYFETFAGETGYTATATAEVVTAVLNGWAKLAFGRVTPGTVTVTNSAANVTYVEDTDYVIDHAAGRIKALATITNAQSIKVTYTYTAIRKGEMAPIERGKITLAFMTIEAAADRIADQISREAIVFSRSQMGMDIVARTMANLVRQLRRKIDQGIIYAALTAVKALGSTNSGGSWVEGATQDDYAELVRLLGTTKLKVHNRYYEPTFILASATNAEQLSNWDGFKRDGFPDAVLTAAGFVGNVKGLPVFQSTEMPDTEILVGNRQLVLHRVYQPALINGPYPTYDVSGGTSKLIAADQYYVEEFNNTEVPVAEKGAFLSIVEGS
jgi:hypothetical protein